MLDIKDNMISNALIEQVSFLGSRSFSYYGLCKLYTMTPSPKTASVVDFRLVMDKAHIDIMEIGNRHETTVSYYRLSILHSAVLNSAC